jgi:hypothetical protein
MSAAASLVSSLFDEIELASSWFINRAFYQMWELPRLTD